MKKRGSGTVKGIGGGRTWKRRRERVMIRKGGERRNWIESKKWKQESKGQKGMDRTGGGREVLRRGKGEYGDGGRIGEKREGRELEGAGRR